jgi:hypothetical protein
VSVLKAPSEQPKTTNLQVRLEEEGKRNLDRYAEFPKFSKPEASTLTEMTTNSLRSIQTVEIQFEFTCAMKSRSSVGS